MNASNRREVMDRSLSHRSGPVPIDFGSTAVTGMHISVVAELRRHYGLQARPVRLLEPYQMLGEVDDELKAAMGVDTEALLAPSTIFGFRNERYRPWRTPWGQEILVPRECRFSYTGGDVRIHPQGDLDSPPSGRMPEGGYFFDSIPRQEPIVEDLLDPKDNLEEFTPISDEDLRYYRDEADRTAGTGRAVVMTLPGTGLGDIALVPAPFLKRPKGIRDVAEWYISTAARRDYVSAVFDAQTDIALANIAKIHGVVGAKASVAFLCGTDFGTQTSSFCSTETFRSLYSPFYRKMNDWIHRNTNWKTFKHSCGAIASFMPHFIDAGFDIINPVQLSASGMSAGALKKEFGDRIVFWGGGTDTQKTLPFGTPSEVRDEVRRRCEVLAESGGFVFNAVHNVQARTPARNIAAMIEAAAEFR